MLLLVLVMELGRRVTKVCNGGAREETEVSIFVHSGANAKAELSAVRLPAIPLR